MCVGIRRKSEKLWKVIQADPPTHNTQRGGATSSNRVRKCFTTRNNLNKRFRASLVNGAGSSAACLCASIGSSFKVDDYRHSFHTIRATYATHFTYSPHISYSDCSVFFFLFSFFSFYSTIFPTRLFPSPSSPRIGKVWDSEASARDVCYACYAGVSESHKTSQARLELRQNKKRRQEKKWKNFSVFAWATFIIVFLSFPHSCFSELIFQQFWSRREERKNSDPCVVLRKGISSEHTAVLPLSLFPPPANSFSLKYNVTNVVTHYEYLRIY